MAMPLAVVRSWVVHAMQIMGQTSRCCMVCLMPQSQDLVSVSFEYPHFGMFTLARLTCVRNRLRAFQVVQGVRGSLRRVDGLSTFDVTLPRFHAWLAQLRDVHWSSGCLSSVLWRVRSVRLATALLVSHWAIPASMTRLFVFVRFRQPGIHGWEYRWQYIILFARLVSFANCLAICLNYLDQWLWCVNRLPNISMSAFSHLRCRSRYDLKKTCMA